MSSRFIVPLDVRLMNGVTVLLWLGIGLGFFAGVGTWVARHPSWTLARIVVEGQTAHQNEMLFRAQLAPHLQGSFLTIDLQEVKRLFEEVPWVKDAVVYREFPNRLRVTLDEQEGAAWWGPADSGKLLNQEGDIFQAEVDGDDVALTKAWPQLDGPDDRSHEVFALYHQLQPIFQNLDAKLVHLHLNESGHWSAGLDNGLDIELGRGSSDELLDRIHKFVSTLPQLMSRYPGRSLELADLRYPNGYAVRMRGVQTVMDDKAADALIARVQKKQTRH